MSRTCEKCWSDAYWLSREDTTMSQAEHYLALIAHRDHCSKCGQAVNPDDIVPKDGKPILCLDCLYPGSDAPPGTVLTEHEGEALDVIPSDPADQS